MAADKKKKKQAEAESDHLRVCSNRKARHLYEIIDEIDCGIRLVGSEVKSIRAGKISIEEGYARMRDKELWLVNCNINEYPQANLMNHEPTQQRKLLLHRRELDRFAQRADERGFTLVPLEVFFQRGFVKVRIGLAKGRKEYDKRDVIKRESDRKEMRAATRKRF